MTKTTYKIALMTVTGVACILLKKICDTREDIKLNKEYIKALEGQVESSMVVIDLLSERIKSYKEEA